MLADGEGRYGIERVYSNRLDAQKRKIRFESRGAYFVLIEKEGGKYILTAWFDSHEKAISALN